MAHTAMLVVWGFVVVTSSDLKLDGGWTLDCRGI